MRIKLKLFQKTNIINDEVYPRNSKTIGSNHHLVDCLQHGFAFHYGPLPERSSSNYRKCSARGPNITHSRERDACAGR